MATKPMTKQELGRKMLDDLQAAIAQAAYRAKDKKKRCADLMKKIRREYAI